jgi:phosphoglycerate dehydrogenase-like enzyme
MLGAEQFAMMKDDAIFINTSRGSIVDEKALIAELRKQRIHAILDVTEPEPPSKDHPFRTLPNVMLTPHIAGAISNGCYRQGRLCVNQVLAYAAGRKVPGEVTAAALAIMA